MTINEDGVSETTTETLTHTRTCLYWDEDKKCTCCLQERIHTQTAKTVLLAWQKRATESERAAGAEEMRERCAKVCDKIRFKWNAIYLGTTVTDPLHDRASHQSNGADECRYMIEQLPAARKEPK